MAARIVKELKGFSGSNIYLMTKHDRLWIRKQGHVRRNLDQYHALKDLLPMPKILNAFNDVIDMEYIHGSDMRSYLLNYPAEPLMGFLIDVIHKLSQDSHPAQYHDRVEEFLDLIDISQFRFSRHDVLAQIPTTLPCSQYHGDLTLENIIYSDTRGFCLIDAQSGIWDSYIFDICKLRQDLECHWFLRDQPAFIDNKLSWIQSQILQIWPEADNPALLTLMLLRVFRYATPGSQDHKFLIKAIEQLWK